MGYYAGNAQRARDRNWRSLLRLHGGLRQQLYRRAGLMPNGSDQRNLAPEAGLEPHPILLWAEILSEEAAGGHYPSVEFEVGHLTHFSDRGRCLRKLYRLD